jgi:hypothetical protein
MGTLDLGLGRNWEGIGKGLEGEWEMDWEGREEGENGWEKEGSGIEREIKGDIG